jgi:hypothetical protein
MVEHMFHSSTLPDDLTMDHADPELPDKADDCA